MSIFAIPGNLFCFGLGFSAQALARKLISKRWVVSGTFYQNKINKSVVNLGVPAYHFNGVISDEINKAINDATHLLISIPPQDSGDVVLNQFNYHNLNWNHLKWIGYISSTGVYGDAQGGWVDETSPLNPISSISHRRVKIETAWLNKFNNHRLPVVIFRCAGIYGPGRNTLLSVKEGRAKRIKKPGHVFSRIHVDDLAQTLEASILNPQLGDIYNVSDDLPCASSDVVEYACRLLNISFPPIMSFESAELTDIAYSFYSANKRVSNKKIKSRLGVRLIYPNYRVGLDTIFNRGQILS